MSYPMRSVLVGVREPGLYSASPMASPGNICRRWCTSSTGWITLTSSHKRRGKVNEGESSFSKGNLSPVSAPAPSSSSCGHHLLAAAAHQNLTIRPALSIHPQLPPPTPPKIRFEPRQCCILKHSTQTPKGLSTRPDSSNNMHCLQPQYSLWNISLLPVCIISPSHNRRIGVFLPRVIGSAAYRPATLTLCGHALWNQSRALHQATPRKAIALRDCLSLENEQRCRRSLGRNLKLYEAGRGAAQDHGRSQGRWASILVSLCSVQGEPAFLFTLRSSKLKKNKGDVRWVPCL